MFFLNGAELQKTLFVVIGVSLIYCGVSDIFVILFIAEKFHQFLESFESSNVVIEAEVKPTVESDDEQGEKSE